MKLHKLLEHEQENWTNQLHSPVFCRLIVNTTDFFLLHAIITLTLVLLQFEIAIYSLETSIFQLRTCY